MRYLLLLLLSFSANAQEPNISFDEVYEVLVGQHYCKSCHSSQYGNKQAGLDMDYERAYENLVGFPASQSSLLRVNPGDPESSYLIKKLRGDSDVMGMRMPLGGPYLSESELEFVSEWIRTL